MRLRSLFLVLALAGCSASTPIVEDTPTPTATPTPTPTKAAVQPVAREAVFAADNAIWLYNVKNDTLRELARGRSVSQPRWLSKTQVSFVQGFAGNPQTLSLIDIPKRSVSDSFTVQTGIEEYGWSPDRETVAYITTDRLGYPHLEYRSIGAGVTQSVATLARAGGRESTVADQRKVAFDRSGQYVLVVDTFADGDDPRSVPQDQSQFQVRSITGALAFAVDHFREPTMGEWARGGTTLHYVTESGLRSWKTGSRDSRSVAGRKWFDPWASPDGNVVAYDTGATSKRVTVEMLALKTGARTVLTKAGFFHPVIASAGIVWVQRVTPCTPDCLNPVEPSPEVFAVDVKTKKTKKLALTTLMDLDVRYE